MANRKRNIQMKFWVTEEEKQLINKKMAQLPTKRYGAYLRKMAIDGYIIHVDTTDITMRSAAPATGSAKSMVCLSSFPAGTREKATLSIRRNKTAPATRRSCVPSLTGSCPAAPTWRTCSAASSGKGTS